ncbi:MAG: MSCRAMM family protein, partial [Planctomycetota bacterium]
MKSKPARVVVLLCLMVAAILVWLVTRGPAAPVGRADSLERAEELPAADGAPGARDDSERSPEGISNPLGGTILPPRKEPAKAKEQPKPYRLAEHLGDDTNSGLRVKVVDEGGVPWSGARIWASRYGRDGLRDRTKRESAADGAVELLGLQPGKWQLLVGAGEMNRITKVELVGGRMTEATIEMSRTGGIMQGVVRHRRKGPLAEVTVRLSSHGAVYNDYLHARTDEGGGYRLSAIPPGTYSVYAEGEGIGYPPRRFEDLVVEAGETVVRDLAIGVVSLGGLVQDAATGRPLAGVEVNLQKPVYRMRNTDPDGRYSLFDLPSGDGVLVMSKEGYELYWVRDFKIVAGEQQTIDVSLQPAATIVFEVVDSEGRPVVGRLSLSISRP